MQILFVSTNRNRYLAPAPIGAALIADRLRQAGHRVRFLDLMHVRHPQAEIRKAIEESKPQLFCFSVRNVDNQQMEDLDSPLPEIAGTIRLAQQLSDAPSLIGGSAVITFPRQLRGMLNATYAYAGDDADAAVRFVASLKNGAPDTSVPGLVYEHDGEVHSNPVQPRGYAGVSFTGHDLLDLRAYRRAYYDCGVVTHSGCAMGCLFCDVHLSFGRETKLHDPREVVDEVTRLKRKLGVGFRVQPDTPLRQIAQDEGVIAPDDDCFNPTFYCSAQAPPEQVWSRVRAFKRRHPLARLRMMKLWGRMMRDRIFGLPS